MIKKYFLALILLSNFTFCKAMQQPRIITGPKQELQNKSREIHRLRALFIKLKDFESIPVEYQEKTVEEIEIIRNRIQLQITQLLEESHKLITQLKQQEPDSRILEIIESAN